MSVISDFLKQILIWINDEENNKLSVQSDTKSEDKRLVLKRDEYYIEMSLSVVKEKKNKSSHFLGRYFKYFPRVYIPYACE